MQSLYTRYGAGYTTAPSADYPHGSAKNETNPGVSKDSLPYEKDWVNEFQGFAQAALLKAGTTVSGLVETARASQILDALTSVIKPRLHGWTAGGATITGDRFDFSAQASGGVRVQWVLDGTIAYVLDTGTERVYQYSASEPYMLRSLSYDSLSFDVSSLTEPNAITVSRDGVNLYIGSGTSSVAIAQYALGTVGDISTASFVASFSLSGDARDIKSISFSVDGAHLLVTGKVLAGIVLQCTRSISLATPWAISTASDTGDDCTYEPGSTVSCAAFDEVGSSFIVYSRNNEDFFGSWYADLGVIGMSQYLTGSEYAMAGSGYGCGNVLFMASADLGPGSFALDGSRCVVTDADDSAIAYTVLSSQRV